MGLFDFVKDVGHKLFGSKDEAPEKIKEHIEEDNPGIEGLEVSMNDDGTVSLSGKAASKEAMEKAVLMAGNIEGVSNVDTSNLEVPEEESAEVRVEYYIIQKGDTLWKIAEKFYGNGAKYTKIVEDNKEVIKDPDKIFPGQKIRIVLES
ncbi:MAG: peptidoglycan-binding protein LysM [Epsilonproteobacteria bacterium]|nr:peptidoglycan-binding protein LysM [Campylobacterota bacterium]